jgi:trehalose-6-phosphate synthase
MLTRLCRDTDANEHGVHIDGRSVEVGNFPIGISPEEFDKLLVDNEVQATFSVLKHQLAGTKTIVGVDRTDYIKGIPEKLRAFDKFLSDYPEKRGKTKLIQVAIPSREDCVEYAKVVREVESLVGEINGKHGTSERLNSVNLDSPKSP